MSHPSHDFRVPFTAPLRGVRLVDPRVPLPPLAVKPQPVPDPVPHPQLVPVPIPEKAEEEGEGEQEQEREETPPPASLGESEIAQALAEDRAWIERAFAVLTSKIDALHETRRREWREWQRNAVELALTVATRLLRDRFAAGDYPIEAVARELLDEVRPAGPLGAERPQTPGWVTVHLHPDDLALLQRRLGDAPLVEGRDDLTILPDPTLGRGDCRVESGDSLALAQLPVQLAEMRRRMLRSLGHAPA